MRVVPAQKRPPSLLASYDSTTWEKQINTNSVRHVNVIIVTDIYSTQLRYLTVMGVLPPLGIFAVGPCGVGFEECGSCVGF